MEITVPRGVSAQKTRAVAPSHSAREVGSGNIDVLATPMMIALMEAAALEAVQSYLPEGWTTVGTRVECDHLRATPLGDDVSVTAVLVRRDGRTLHFRVEARDSQGIIGKGRHRRFIVDIEKFLSKLGGRRTT